MDEAIRQRCIAIGQHVVKHRCTVREAAQFFGISKSAVHKDLRKHLPEADPSLAVQVAALLDYHRAIRHLRGGEATRLHYARKKGFSFSAN